MWRGNPPDDGKPYRGTIGDGRENYGITGDYTVNI
jgi:hypothetical protein